MPLVTGSGSGRTGSLTTMHLRVAGRMEAEFLVPLAIHSGERRLRVSRKMGAFGGGGVQELLLLFIFSFIWMISYHFDPTSVEYHHSNDIEPVL